MRKYTLVFSITAHAIVVAAVIIAPAVATDELPEPWRSTAFIVVKPLPSVPTTSRQQNPDERAAAVAPVVPPDGVRTEAIVESTPGPIFDVGAPSSEVPVGDAIARSDVLGPPPAPPRPKEPLRPGGSIQPPKKIVHVAPVYPPIALAAGREGLVIVEALIAEDGTVRDVRVLRSAPLFDNAAVAAVRQWRFSPTLLNGEPVPIVMTVTVGFTLNK